MDDLVGIALCLQLLEELPTLKAVFYRDEEVGLIGAKAFNLSFFDDCAYVIEIDRRDNDDFSISMGGVDVNSKEFVTACTPFLKKYKYKESYTSITDVYNLKLRGLNISVTNVSCGYYNPHSSNETVSITDVNNCYCMVFDIICNITNKKYVHNYKPPVYNNPHAYGYNNNQGVIIRYHDMYLDIHNYDKDGYYLYNGLAKTITITESYSYLIDIKAIFNKKTLQYFFLDKWFKGEYDEIQERRINYLLKKIKIQDGGQTFVYNYLYDNWLLEKHAVLYECGENASTYITKATYEEWANYKK